MARHVAGTVRAQGSRAPLVDLVVEVYELKGEAGPGEVPPASRSRGSSRTGRDGRFAVESRQDAGNKPPIRQSQQTTT